MRSDTWYSEAPTENGKRIFHSPAISTFSDHIVISYRVADLIKTLDPHPRMENIFSVPLSMMQPTIGDLAAGALRLGLLIRGGITVGPLYHQAGVVIGKAMNEAYDLEARVASYPRVVVSKKVYSRAQINPREKFLPVDTDGITHYNYFTNLILDFNKSQAGSGLEHISAGYELAMQLIEENIEKFEAAEKWNPLSKWAWMKSTMLQTRARMNDALFTKKTA